MPRLITEKFDDLARQVRRLRLYRGLARVVVAAIVLGVVGVALERALVADSSLRWVISLTWLAAMLLAVWQFVLKPQQQLLTTSALAAAIEAQFPSLSERLSTLVELSASTDVHGSKPLMDLLVRDTAQRTKRLDFEKAAPSRSAIRGVLLAGVLLGAGLAAVLLLSGGGTRLKQFILPWHTPKIEAPFVLKVSSGSVTVKRGEAVTLTAYLERRFPDAVLPSTAVLMVRDAAGVEKKLPMTGDDQAAFTLTRPSVRADFEYRVEAEPLASEWFTVRIVDPVELSSGTTIALNPPAYAAPPYARIVLPGFAPVEGLQYSQVAFQLHFDRPATTATLGLQSVESASAIDGERIPLALATDGRSATATTTLVAAGNYRLTLVGGQGVKTSVSISARAVADAPPRFEKVTGLSEQTRAVRPGESIILEVAAVDDIRVAAVLLEYQVNSGAPQTLPLKLKDLQTPRAEGKQVWSLTGLVKEGDALKYRLRVTDNRSVPAAGLLPQNVYYPESAWAQLTISATAESLDQQDILAKRDAIKARLDEAAAAANEARKQTERLRRDLADNPMLSTDQKGRLQDAQAAAAKAAQALDDAAREAALSPELRSLADALRGAADQTLRPAEDKLRRSENDPDVRSRNAGVADADQKLNAARDRIAELQMRNEEIARNRLDKRRLEKLAHEVSRLSEEAQSTIDPAQRAALQKKLQRAQEELRDVVNGNESLRQGAADAANHQAKQLADQAAKLQNEQAGLDAAVGKSEASARQKALAGNATAQDQLNQRADELRQQTATPSRLAGNEPLAKPPFEKAKQSLTDGDSVAAMTEQEKAARELDRLAESLERAAAARSDPREAARQLAQLQDHPAPRESSPRRTDEKTAQEELRKATEKLTTPPDHSPSAEAKAAALEKLKAAETAPSEATRKEAAEALRKLAEALPPRSERLKKAQAGLEKLQREHDALSREVDEKLKPFERRKPDEHLQKEIQSKTAAAATAQAEIAKKLDSLDVPGLESRRGRTSDAARRAADDLSAGRPQDIPASQGDLKRRMAQLRTALDGTKPGDTLADELARRQNELAKQTEASPDAAALAKQQHLQREIADAAAGLHDPDGAERLQRARQSTEAAAKQFQRSNDVDELRRKSRQAAQDLDDLADHLAGAVSDQERVERLAKDRRSRAEWSKSNAAKATPLEEATIAAGELDRELADLKQTRVGPAQEEKKKAADALERLRRTPNAERAPTLQKAAADALDQLAKKMTPPPTTARPDRSPRDSDSSGDCNGQLGSPGDAAQAREMAKQQREIRDRTAQDAAAAKGDDTAAARQNQQQKALAQQASDLAKDLEKASHAPTTREPAATALTQASEQATAAQDAMEKAAREQSSGHSTSAAQARQEAAAALEQAKAKAASAAGPAGGTPNPQAAAASKAAGEANEALHDAGQKPEACAECLRKAADQIGNAANHLGEAGQPKPSSAGTMSGYSQAASKPLSAAELPPDLKHYAGKAWGELPGEVKTRVIQDLKSKYGEDYARVIKLYFEQLAEKK